VTVPAAAVEVVEGTAVVLGTVEVGGFVVTGLEVTGPWKYCQSSQNIEE